MSTNFDPSIYNIQETVNDVVKHYIPNESEDTLVLGTFGYLEEISALQIQNNIILNSELGNEIWPSRAKYDKNIIAHSIIQNIVDINAKPSIIIAYIGFEEEKINSLFVNDVFTIDKDYAFRVGSFDFHLEYDLRLERSRIMNEEYVYSARYNIGRKNKISKITNPYTSTPYIQKDNGKKMIYIQCQLMQVSHNIEYRKVITSSSIDNKTFEFSFDDQLADFEVAVTERGMTTYLNPIFDGSAIENEVEKYCYYTYVDSKTIRVRFDSLSYLPTLNADVEIFIKTTKGAEGNFEYNEVLQLLLTSEKYNYKNLAMTIRLGNESTGGEDRKSIEELRRLLPKEALSRGSITTLQDLRNYFNTMILDAEKTRIYVTKKINNDFEKRAYYAYLVMKDRNNNVIPTNTINLEISKSSFDSNDNRKYVLKPGCYIVYEDGIGRIYKKDDKRLSELLKNDTTNFIYTIPFMLVVTADPLYVSYYLAVMNYPAYLSFDYINQNSDIQFISTLITWTRQFLTTCNDCNYEELDMDICQNCGSTNLRDNNTYFLDMETKPNISDGKDFIELDDKGNIINSRVKAVMVFYNDDALEPYRYAYGNVVGKDSSTGKYHIQFKFTTKDLINDDNRIRVEDVHETGSGASTYGFFTNHVSVKIYILYQSHDGSEYGVHNLNTIVPTDELKGWSVTNMYSVNGGLNFYYNYSQIMSSTVTDTTVLNEYGDEIGFNIKSVPVIKHSYMNNEHNIQALISQFNYEKAYIDNAISLLENNFLIDFKLFNTYGKSTMYSIDRAGKNLVDRIHLTLNFEVRLLKTSDNNTKKLIRADIKQMIEDLNDMESLHIPNLITTITNTYRNSIEYIEFVGINGYGPEVQHLYKHEKDDITIVPEFLTINNISDENLDPDASIDINITLV